MHGFFNTAGPTEDFRERQTPGRSLAGRMQTRVHLHMFFVPVFDSFSATG